MPARSAKLSKVKRESAPIGSRPISPNIRPSVIISRPLTNRPDEVAAITIMLSSRIAASSGGPNCSAIRAIGPIRRMVTTSLERSPNTEATSAMSSALRACFLRASGAPSRTVATAAPVPGIDSRIAGMLPPKMPPL